MENRTLIFALHEMEGIGWKTILKLVGGLEDLQQLFFMREGELTALGLLRPQATTILTRLTPAFIEEKQEFYRKQGIRVLTFFDEAYPALLRETSQPPWVLYYRGDASLLNRPTIGMVGTRTPTAYGKKIALELSAVLSRSGFTVASGLARGIDGCSHEGALKGRGKTVAVLGCGMDQIYPREHAALYRQIAEEGVILSEYPAGTLTRPGMFPLRNRIIAGLSLGVVIVEAAEGSGSLITSDSALEESRDVFAVPGPITSPKSQGTLKLLKEGAKIVTCAEDIIEEYKHMITYENFTHSKPDGAKSVHDLTEDERIIYDFLSSQPVTIDELIEHSQFTFGHLHSVLLNLTMKKLIEPLPGSAYIVK
jgi:DNA processing protein